MENNKKNKNGSIFYDKKDKRFKCAYYITDKDTLQEIRKTKSFFTEQEAKEFLTGIQYQKGNDLFIKNNGIPLNQLMRENVERKLELNIIGERTYHDTLKIIKQIEKHPTSRKNINDITSKDIQEYLDTLKNYASSTIKKRVQQFSQAFDIAIKKHYIFDNPMNNIVRPKSTTPKKVVRALEIEEQQKLTNYLMNIPISLEKYKIAYLIEMYLGLRIGEVLALRSTDINLHKNLISVNKTLTRDKNNKVIMGNTTKTYAGIREVPIPSFIKDEIISQMKLSENNRDKQLFLDKNGNYVRPATANDKLKVLINKLGLAEDITSHSLRHTFGTRCIEAGIRPVALQRLMGHTDVSVTLNTYTSVFNKYKEAELEKVNNYYMNNYIIQPNQSFLDNNNIVNQQQLLSEKESTISEKKKRLLNLYKMIGNAVTKGLIPIAEYMDNLEYLQKLEQQLLEEEKGERIFE